MGRRCQPRIPRSSILLQLTTACVLLLFIVLKAGFGLDSSRTLEIGTACKVAAILVYAPLALLADCWFLYRATDSPNADGFRLRVKYPNYWMLVGAAKAAFLILVTVLIALDICAMLAPRWGGEVQHVTARVAAVRNGDFGLSNCARYVELEMPDAESERICFRRKRTPDVLNSHEPMPGEYVSLRTQTNALATYVDMLTRTM